MTIGDGYRNTNENENEKMRKDECENEKELYVGLLSYAATWGRAANLVRQDGDGHDGDDNEGDYNDGDHNYGNEKPFHKLLNPWQIPNTSKNAKDYHLWSTFTFRKLYIQKFKRLVAFPPMILDYSQSSVSKSAIKLYFNCGISVGV